MISKLTRLIDRSLASRFLVLVLQDVINPLVTVLQISQAFLPVLILQLQLLFHLLLHLKSGHRYFRVIIYWLTRHRFTGLRRDGRRTGRCWVLSRCVGSRIRRGFAGPRSLSLGEALYDRVRHLDHPDFLLVRDGQLAGALAGAHPRDPNSAVREELAISLSSTNKRFADSSFPFVAPHQLSLSLSFVVYLASLIRRPGPLTAFSAASK